MKMLYRSYMQLFGTKKGVSFMAIAAVLLFFSTAVTAGERKTRNILVLHSYHQGLHWTDSITQGIQSEITADRSDIEIHYRYLDTKRHPGQDYFNALVDSERIKAVLTDAEFEVIISSDNNALQFILEYGDDLYADIPVVFCGVNNFHPGLLKGKTRFTGVVEAIDYKANLNLMRNLHPYRRKLFVILDKTATGIAIKKEFEAAAEAFSDHFEFEYYQDFVLEEVPSKISSLKRDDIIYMLTFNRDRNGKFISYVDGIHLVYNAANVPIYGSWQFYFGNGIVGGMITSGYSQGQQAAKLAKQILAGTPVDQIPVITKSPNRYMFDYNAMKQFGMNTSQLPTGSHIINQPPDPFYKLKKIIIAILGVVVVAVLILSWRLMVQKRKQAALRQTNIELDRRVAEQTADLREKNQLLTNEIDVRLKIEKDLIDNTGRLEQALAKVKTLSGLLPICSHCKKIRDDKGYWNQIESYLRKHSDATLSHGICPDCVKELYPNFLPKDKKR